MQVVNKPQASSLEPNRIRLIRPVLGAALLLVGLASVAQAQYAPPGFSREAIGEKYHIEFGGTFWNTTPFGIVSSEQFGLVGSNIDFVTDLGFVRSRFREMQLTLRPGPKHKFRFQYTPIVFTSDTQFHRDIVFNGQAIPMNVPVTAELDWKVLRIGYEYDFIKRDRGFVGFMIEGRLTDFTAKLNTPIPDVSEFTTVKGPLPAIGVVGRAYVLPNVALNFEVSGFKVPNIQKKYQAAYFDWNISGTVNLTNNVGAVVGWRKMTTFLAISNDKGDMKFQGMWFGGVLRY